MMPEMNEIYICKYCGKPEYWGEFIWLSGRMLCRDCYKKEWEEQHHRPCEFTNLDGVRPTMEEYERQEAEKDVNEEK